MHKNQHKPRTPAWYHAQALDTFVSDADNLMRMIQDMLSLKEAGKPWHKTMAAVAAEGHNLALTGLEIKRFEATAEDAKRDSAVSGPAHAAAQ